MKFTKKAGTILLSSALLLNTITPPLNAAPVQDNSQALSFSECEDLAISNDLKVTTSIWGEEKPGYTGDGFVWMQGSGTITLTITVKETGMYSVSTRYMQELSEEGRLQYLYVNGKSTGSYMLPYATDWTDFSFGVHKLNAGKNTIQIKSGWGYAYFDSLTVDVAKLPSLTVDPVLCDSKATKETQTLMNYLTSVYGKHILSGQQEIYGSGNDGNYELEFDWIHDLTGKYPAIRGFDFMNYNPLYGWEDETTDRIIDWVNNRGGIAAACWHINVPKDFQSYELGEFVDWQKCTYKPNDTNFDTSKAVVPGTKEYEYVQLIIEDLAEQLKIAQDNNVPVIFRPFHEAEGNGGEKGEGAWFWWASAGADVYKQLWKMLYTELTQTYGIHNLIWEYNSYTYSSSPAWYPGNDYVDIVGYDKYNTVYNRYDGLSGVPNEDAISSIFYQLVQLTEGKKMVAMPENDTIPNVENLTVEKAAWLYFCPWYGEYLMSESYNYKDTIADLYQSDYVLTLDELPDLKASGQTPTKKPEKTPVPATSPSPIVSEAPLVSPSPAVSKAPVVSEKPVVSPSPVVSEKPVVSPSPVVTPSSAASGVKPVVKVTTQNGGSINQSYNISAAGTDRLDLSKLAIRYYYDKTGNKAQTFWCDNAGLQLKESPWYANISENVTGTFQDDYLEITFDTPYSIAPNAGSLSMGVRFAQSDWSGYTDFAEKDIVVYYDGTVISQ
ncbi:glycosyl hydrolase [[Clostridium] polysaccharolyticum]|uniref:Mannan endo-1,4-beta-mannosidase n=1 Tax=[Clostridium] polysaccharolyticum TaxID=29364 RepID=A0A1H9ZXN5_9FIRM|nr:glycosyl hydrolase [[Clostridium] polysaccharolyticum]SES86564.1 mannan endo-1,4-beta-mannosidase [[Clostridium] polysaccharolyticum]